VRDYRWDRAATVLGALASGAIIWCELLDFTPMRLVEGDLLFGGIGLAIAVSHARWRGPADPSRGRLEHLTSMLAAYQVRWSFVFALYIRVLPRTAQVLIPGVLGVVAILWARRRFGEAAQMIPLKALAS
jgi:hypothetical protein